MPSTPISVKTFLSNIPLFRELAAEEIDRISAQTKMLRLDRGTVLFQRGDDCEGFHVVVFGQVKLAFISRTGDEKVVDLLRNRVTGATKDGLAPKLTSTTISFRYSTDKREDPWTDAVMLLSKIAIRSRELIADRFKPRELKVADILLPDYLKAMNVLDDALVVLGFDKGWDSPWVIDRAIKETEMLETLISSDAPGEVMCQRLIALIQGRTTLEI